MAQEENKDNVQTAPETEQNAEETPSGTASAEESKKENAPETETGSETKKKNTIDDLEYEEAYEEIYKDILEHFRSFSPSEEIAFRITEDHITEYLEGNREERMQQYKERREKQLFNFLELLAILVTIVLVVKFLGNNPTILVNILYIVGGLGALFIWKGGKIKKDK